MQRDRHLRWLSRLSALLHANGLGWPELGPKIGVQPTTLSEVPGCPGTPLGFLNVQAAMVCVSTRTPTPMVEDKATLRR